MSRCAVVRECVQPCDKQMTATVTAMVTDACKWLQAALAASIDAAAVWLCYAFEVVKW